MTKKIFTIPTAIYGITICLLLLDSYRSNTTVQTHLGLSSIFLAGVFIVCLILLRLFTKQKLNPTVSRINTMLVIPVALGGGIILTMYGAATPPNYVYAATNIQYAQLVFLGIFALFVWLLDHSDQWFTNNYPKVIFFGAFVSTFLAYITSLFPFYVFHELVKEDNVVENLQIFVLLIGAFFSWRSAFVVFKKRQILSFVLLIVIGCILFFSAADEFSWGQRLFHLTLPEPMKSYNTQGEITIHNMYQITAYVIYGYIIIGLLGSIFWAFQKILPVLKKEPFVYVIPPWFCSPYFFACFLYNFYTFNFPKHGIGIWSEPAELMLYLGIMFTMMTSFLKISKK